MKVNGNHAAVKRAAPSRDSARIPTTVTLRTKGYEMLLGKWRAENQRVPWACLLEDGLKLALKRYAGKRYAHLVADKEGQVAA